MKCQFVFNGRKYLAENKREAQSFIKFWDSFFSKIHPLQSTWNIKGIEVAPGWVPIPVFDTDQIEYEKK